MQYLAMLCMGLALAIGYVVGTRLASWLESREQFDPIMIIASACDSVSRWIFNR